jgi:hypothetical protein
MTATVRRFVPGEGLPGVRLSSGAMKRRYACGQGNLEQLGETACIQAVHDLGAVQFDRAGADAEFLADDLVRSTVQEADQHLTLPSCQSGNPSTRRFIARGRTYRSVKVRHGMRE